MVIGVSALVFFLFNVLPGDPARMMLGQRADVQSVQTINRELGLDQPPLKRFALYINDLSPICLLSENPQSSIFADVAKYGKTNQLVSFGERAIHIKTPYLRRSYQSNRLVGEILMDSLKGTFILSIAALLLASLVGIPLGVISAVRKNKFIDHAIGMIAAFGMA
ncbi:MAG: ABC transporter permease, partial [Bacteroidota bacterium]